MSIFSSDRKPFSIKNANPDDTKIDNGSSVASSFSTLSRFKDYLMSSSRKSGGRPSDEIELLKPLDLTDDYERINTVGVGSFGIAVLYRRLKDDLQVVLKQINLMDLNKTEREMAMNEVEVFSKLHHPNIITYYGSFIKGETLLIEMEYADGGTLSQVLAQNTEYLPERFILNVFEQITSAIQYMHSENILHRDLKTANVFLTLNGLVKIGDFGISKIMNTKINTKTILGTPYYFSPEMCEGKEYDEKSDIWALGCILGEMCLKQKTFSASNLSELVSKIMSGNYLQLPEYYSDGMKHLYTLMLQINPTQRPTAHEIQQYWVPFIYRNLGKFEGYSYGDTAETSFQASKSSGLYKTSSQYLEASTATMNDLKPTERSVLYQCKSFANSFSLDPIQLPSTLQIRQIVSSNGNHFIVVTKQGSVYTWGEGKMGQLGHSVDSWKHFPTKVDSIRRYNIVSACAGDGFSIFLTDFGVLLSCGENTKGCLGRKASNNPLDIRTIEKLSEVQIKQIAAGSSHVLALDSTENVYSWGSSKHGALGVGNNHFASRPTRIPLSQQISGISKIFCGPDCSLILLKCGDVYACGSNIFNKLGFGKKVETVEAFKKMNIFNKKIIDLSVGSSHSAFLTESGFLITMGNNNNGQRGLGHTKRVVEPTILKLISDKFVTNVKCFSTYTVVATKDQLIIFWGTRYGVPDANDNSSSDTANFAVVANSTAAVTSLLASVYQSEMVLVPKEILGLFASKQQLDKGYYLKLDDLIPLQHSILILIETTTPLVSV